MKTFGQLREAMAGLRVLVIGEAMLDSYLSGSAHRLCPEAPVPVVNVSQRRDVPGGAANTAVNAASLGGQVTFLSVLGDDWEGTRLQQALEEWGVSTEHLLTRRSRQTLAKQRLIASDQLLVRFDQGSTDPVDPETEQWLIEQLTQHFPTSDAVIVSDYAYGLLTPGVVAAIARLQASTPRILAVDSRHLGAYRHVGATVAKPNYQEAVQLLGINLQAEDRSVQIAAHSSRLLELTGALIVAATLDTEGSLITEQGQPLYRTYTQPQPQVQAAGAGDTFISAFTLALAAGASTAIAAELAAAAAAVVVAQLGTTTCDPQQLHQHFSTHPSRWLTSHKLPHKNAGGTV